MHFVSIWRTSIQQGSIPWLLLEKLLKVVRLWNQIVARMGFEWWQSHKERLDFGVFQPSLVWRHSLAENLTIPSSSSLLLFKMSKPGRGGGVRSIYSCPGSNDPSEHPIELSVRWKNVWKTCEHASGEDDVQKWDVWRWGAHYHWCKQGTWAGVWFGTLIKSSLIWLNSLIFIATKPCSPIIAPKAAAPAMAAVVNIRSLSENHTWLTWAGSSIWNSSSSHWEKEWSCHSWI